MEITFQSRAIAFAKAPICKRKHHIWGPEQELVITLPPAGFSAPLELCLRRGFEFLMLRLF